MRRSRLSTAAADPGLYPSRDAQNKVSLHPAEKLGYGFSHQYTSYEIKHK
ncbi:MAG: GNAT family N-acetyltransferase [Lachnospiraceae bacterium]